MKVQYLHRCSQRKHPARMRKQNSKRGLSYILGQTSFADLYIVILQKVIKCLRRHSIGTLEGVDVDVCGCNIGVTKS